MADIRSLKRTYHCWIAAKNNMEQFNSDEYFVNDAAYQLQQCIKLVLKFFLEFKGVTVPYTHNIRKLVDMSGNNGSAVVVTDWIENNKYEITAWETDTRYNFDFFAEVNKVNVGITEVKSFLDLNGVNYTLEDEITPEVKSKIKSFMPKDTIINDDFEWNCYYHVFNKEAFYHNYEFLLSG